MNSAHKDRSNRDGYVNTKLWNEIAALSFKANCTNTHKENLENWLVIWSKGITIIPRKKLLLTIISTSSLVQTFSKINIMG